MELSIIIVNYKTPQLLLDCIESIYNNSYTLNFEVIVVDNDSHDKSKPLILDAFPMVKWIQMDYNSGFARANNQGIKNAGGEVVLLLNSDTIDRYACIEKCYDLLVRSRYVACGAQLLNRDGSPQISGNFVITGGLNHLLPLPVIGYVFKQLALSLKIKKTNIPDTNTEQEIDWINGAFLMVKKAVLKKAGLFDEDFFLYAEEAEWCSRLKKNGPLCIFGQCRIIHLQGETANETFGSGGAGYYYLYDRKGLQIMVSNLLRIRKEFGVAWYIIQLLMYTLTIPIWSGVAFFSWIIGKKSPISSFKNIAGFSKNILTLWRLFPRVLQNKPYFYKML